jgi:ATP-dependent helicase/nuclease subunit A
MDLVFKEKDSWVIADYKTDKVDGNLEALVAYHKPQVEMYRGFYEQISGEKVKEAGLYFTDAAKWITV